MPEYRTGPTLLTLSGRRRTRSALDALKRRKLNVERLTPWNMKYRCKHACKPLIRPTSRCMMHKIKLRHSTQRCCYVTLSKKEKPSNNLGRERLKWRNRLSSNGKSLKRKR